MLALAAAALAVGAGRPPAWIGRAIPPPIVAWTEADVLGTSLPEGVAVSKAGGTYFVGVADSRLQPPEMVLDHDLTKVRPGSRVTWLRAGRLTGGTTKEIGVDVRFARSQGERAWILRVEGGHLRLLRLFRADRIRLTGRTVDLAWPPGHSPFGPHVTRERLRWKRGAYHLVWRK